ncbi:MAG TPA: branched-chain amino acid ABC transporter permease [Thermodesulfobacteriota bacterium]|nr:branched-chain amino acid ABC transporter permease [Thermodesulfobacteriota bacterium]
MSTTLPATNRIFHPAAGAVRKWLPLALVIAAVLIPQVVSNKYYLNILIMSGIWSIVALSLNLILGYTGQVNLAHGAFFGIGAYASALLMLKLNLNFWLALPLASAIAGLLGFLIGLPALRTRGSYFAIGTMCFNIIVTLVVDRWEGLTEGARGIMGVPGPAPIPLPWGGEVAFKSQAAQFYLVLFFLVLTIVVFRRILGSLVGRTFRAIRGNEDLAEAVGIPAMKVKILSFTVSCFFAGIGGVLYASYIGFLSPELTDYHVSFDALIYIMIGGVGTMAGPIIGTLLIVTLPETLHIAAEFRLLFYGLILMVMIIYLPRGIMGAAKDLAARRANRRRV